MASQTGFRRGAKFLSPIITGALLLPLLSDFTLSQGNVIYVAMVLAFGGMLHYCALKQFSPNRKIAMYYMVATLISVIGILVPILMILGVSLTPFYEPTGFEGLGLLLLIAFLFIVICGEMLMTPPGGQK